MDARAREDFLAAIETLLKEPVSRELRAILRRLYLDTTNTGAAR